MISTSLLILLVVIALPILYIVFSYNGLVTARNRVKEGWSDIDVQLKRRYSLIPNIVETVKGYAKHEADVLNQVTEARTKAMNASTLEEHAQAENQITGALKTLFAVSENYPDLKANQNFLQLQNELVDTEDKIQASRRFYNSMAMVLNTKIEQFPSNMIADKFKFEAAQFFEIENGEERKDVEVKF